MLVRILLSVVALGAVYLYTKLRSYRYKQNSHIPQLKRSLLWGHLKTIHEYIQQSGQPDRQIDDALFTMSNDLGRPPLFLVDLFPVSYPMTVITSHHVAEQISKASKVHPWSVPKSPTLRALDYLIGSLSLLTKEGEVWKGFRKRFNPGFAPQHLMTLLPCIVDKTWIFLGHLDSFAATGETFKLFDLTVNLTFDIIGAVVMDVDFDAQHLNATSQGDFVQLYNQLVQAHSFSDARTPWWMAPRTTWRRKQLSKQTDKKLKQIIKMAFKHRKDSNNSAAPERSRSVLNLCLQDVEVLSDEMLSVTCDQVKTFLFAGHDTTSILLTWIFYELSRTPRAAQAIRAELDDIFGPDHDPAVVRAKLLSGDGDELVRRMSYTSAVIKETLRLYPPAGTARYSKKGSGFEVTTEDGQRVPLDGLVLYNCAFAIQRDKAVYGNTADDFVPERWLGNSNTWDLGNITRADLPEGRNLEKKEGGAGDGIPASAWRPFERGPRNCIGQEMANIEVRVILAMTAKRYDFTKVGRGELDLDEKGQGVLNEKGQYKVKTDMYSTRRVTAKPVDDMTVTVKLTETASPLGSL